MPQLRTLESGDSSQSQNEVPTAERTTQGAQENVEEAKKSNTPNPQAADGDLKAWIQCAACFCLFLNSWGIFNTFGVYQTFYELTLLPTRSASQIAWIGSLQGFLLIGLGLPAGPAFDAGYLHTLINMGSFLVVFGMMMTSICKQYWEFMLAQGLVVGLGSGCLFLPAVAVLPPYFAKNRALAIGIAASGSAMGGIIYPIMFHRLQPRVGFGWATRIIAFVALATLSLPVLVLRVKSNPPAIRRLFDLAAWKEVPYFLLGWVVLFQFVGWYIPLVYVQLYSIDQSSVTGNLAFYLLAIVNTGSFVGRLVPTYLAELTGPINIFIPCCLVGSLLAFCWMAISSTAGIIIFALLFGFFSGASIALVPTICISLTPTMAVLGTRLGMQFVPNAVGVLIGIPIAGAILGETRDWTGLQAFCGAMLAVAGLLAIVLRVAKKGYSLREKV